jgi:hypothetical protein
MLPVSPAHDAGLALRDVRGVGAELPGYIELREAGTLAGHAVRPGSGFEVYAEGKREIGRRYDLAIDNLVLYTDEQAGARP